MSIRAWKGQISISLKEEYEEKISRHKEEFRDRSPTREIYARIDEIVENAPSPEEKAEKHRKKAEEHKAKAQKWEKKAERKEARSDLREKKKKLKQLENRIEEVKQKGLKSKEEIEQEIVDKYRDRSSIAAKTEKGIREELGENFERQVERKLDDQPNLENLKRRKQNLEKKVKEYEKILKKN